MVSVLIATSKIYDGSQEVSLNENPFLDWSFNSLSDQGDDCQSFYTIFPSCQLDNV